MGFHRVPIVQEGYPQDSQKGTLQVAETSMQAMDDLPLLLGCPPDKRAHVIEQQYCFEFPTEVPSMPENPLSKAKHVSYVHLS